jgi:hypothetical protein
MRAWRIALKFAVFYRWMCHRRGPVHPATTSVHLDCEAVLPEPLAVIARHCNRYHDEALLCRPSPKGCARAKSELNKRLQSSEHRWARAIDVAPARQATKSARPQISADEMSGFAGREKRNGRNADTICCRGIPDIQKRAKASAVHAPAEQAAGGTNRTKRNASARQTGLDDLRAERSTTRSNSTRMHPGLEESGRRQRTGASTAVQPSQYMRWRQGNLRPSGTCRRHLGCDGPTFCFPTQVCCAAGRAMASEGGLWPCDGTTRFGSC